MRSIVAASLLALTVLTGVATSATADCQVKGWIDSGQGGRPSSNARTRQDDVGVAA